MSPGKSRLPAFELHHISDEKLEAEALISSKAFTFRDTKENPSNRAAQWKRPPACRRGQDVPRGHLAPSLTAGARLAALSPGPKPVALGQLGVLPGPWFLHL